MTRALKEAGADSRFFHLGEGGHYETVLRRMGISFLQIYKRNQPMFILTRLSQALWRFRPQIVFAPQFGDLLQGGLAGRLCNALVLGGVRSDGFYELNSNGRRSRWMLRLAHGLIANSHHGKQNLASRGANPSKMKILPNVLDLTEFDKRSKMPAPISIPSDRVMAVAVGSLQPSKRFDHFLNALALARRKAPALLGVIAGSDCGSRHVLEQQANETGLAPDHVVFLGECDNVPSLLAQAGFLVICSEYEGCPNVILEAMAARLPIISTPVGDAERIVLQNQTGFVVGGDCVQTMADRMVELALSPATRIRLGMEGRKQIEREYEYQSLPTRLLAIFRDFAAENGRCQLAASIHAWLAKQSSRSATAQVGSGVHAGYEQEALIDA